MKMSRCVVSGCAKSGVFVQAFSKAWVSRCDVVGNAFAGVEAMRCVCDYCCMLALRLHESTAVLYVIPRAEQ